MRTRLRKTSIREVELTQEDVEKAIIYYLDHCKDILSCTDTTITMFQAPPSVGTIRPVKDPQGAIVRITHDGEAEEWKEK